MKSAVVKWLEIFPEADIMNRDALYPISFDDFEETLAKDRAEIAEKIREMRNAISTFRFLSRKEKEGYKLALTEVLEMLK